MAPLLISGQSACSKERRTETFIRMKVRINVLFVRAHVLRKEGLRRCAPVLGARKLLSQSACSKERRTETAAFFTPAIDLVFVRAYVLSKDGLRPAECAE